MTRTTIAAQLSRPSIAIARRLATIRHQRFGQDGQSEMATHVGVPLLTWQNFERGVWSPATSF